MISASAIICVCCGLSFADPATDSQDGKEILKEVQVQREAAQARGQGYAFDKVKLEDIQVQSESDLVGNEIALGGRARRRGYVYQPAPVVKNEQQKEEKDVKDEKANADKQDAVKAEQKGDNAKTEQKDAKGDNAKTEQKDAKDEKAKTEQKDAKGDKAKTEQKDSKGDEVKKDDNAAKEDEAKKEESASPFTDPQAALAFQEFNNFRIRNGLKPCEFNQNLQNIAQWHSNNMYNRGQMYHSGTAYVAENVFMGSSSGVYAVRVWINSPGHRANMLGPYRRVGIARTGGFFTMVLQ